MQANKEYKDSVFAKYFNEDPKRLVELYNAVAGTDYPEDTKIEVNSMGDILHKDHIDDLYFAIGEQLVVLMEQQTTDDENVALRVFMYLGRLYEKILGPKALYKSNRISIPEPKFIVLYNGTDELPLLSQQKLSDAFAKRSETPMIDLVVDIVNINHDATNPLLKENNDSESYSRFVESVRIAKAEAELDDLIHLYYPDIEC